jgi:tRNA(fMet)-specific endonuclease VapC
MILLDTDVLIEIFDRNSERGDEALEAILGSGEDIATTSINLHEILYGMEKYAKPVKDVLLLPVLDYTKRDALISAEIEVEAERSGSAIRRMDAMIASVAINHGALLYTFNKEHFKPLEDMGLKLFSAI